MEKEKKNGEERSRKEEEMKKKKTKQDEDSIEILKVFITIEVLNFISITLNTS